MAEAIKQYVLPEGPPSNSYEIIRQMELGIADAKTQDERIHRYYHAVCVMGAWLAQDGYDYKKSIGELEPDEEKLTKEFFNYHGQPLMKALRGFYAHEIDSRRMRVVEGRLRIEYFNVRSQVINKFKEKYGTEGYKKKHLEK